MTDANAPFPEAPMSGFLTFETTDDVRPNDNIEVRATEETEDDHFYEIVSIRENDEIYMYDHKTSSLDTFTKEDVRDILEQENSYHHTILSREVVPIEDAPSDTLVFYVYAVENPKLPDDKRAIQFGWAVENQNPLRDMPEYNESVTALAWEDLREKVSVDGNLPEFYETFDEQAQEAINLAVSVGEFNARKLFGVDGEPTYDEELERRMERDSSSIEDVSQEMDDVYV
jgi:hypothetical protein